MVDFFGKGKRYLEQLRAMPDKKKKIVLWTIVAVLGVVMGIFWTKEAINNFSKIGQGLQSMDLPKIDMPDMPEIDLQKIQEELNQGSIINTTSPSE